MRIGVVNLSKDFEQAAILHEYFSINPKSAIDKRIKHKN